MTGRHTSAGVSGNVDLGKLPAPLTPADCDLRGFGYLPTFGQRLYGSRFYSLALRNPRAGLAGMKLWWEAWTQCPAASLPNDDFDLARMADFGGDLKGWRAVREIALHGFTMCSDGRLYHPFLASEAVKSYEIRLRSDKRRESDRERLRIWREGNRRGGSTTEPEKDNVSTALRETTAETPSETRCETHDETQSETRFVVREGNRREGKVREKKESIAAASSARADDQPQPVSPPQPASPASATETGDPNGDQLHVQGIAVYQALSGDTFDRAKNAIGVLLNRAPPASRLKLMALIREAERTGLDNPAENLFLWLRDRIVPPPPPEPAKPDCPALQPGYQISKMPRLDDPPYRWADLAQDGKFEVDKHGVSRPLFAGVYVDVFCRSLCEAAGITDPLWRGDYDIPLAWLRDGFQPHTHILPVIRAVVARSSQKISRLKYFDAAVRERRSST